MKTFKCKQCKTINNRRNKWDLRIFCSQSCSNHYNFPKRISPKTSKIIECFEKLRSYTEVGLKFNLSRQRIEQIIKKYVSQLVEIDPQAKTKYFTRLYGVPCKHCKKRLGIEVEHLLNGFCTNCRGYNDPNYQPKPKYTHCSQCKISFKKTKMQGYGLCSRCYNSYRYFIYPQVRKKYQKKYYLKNREKLLQMNKEWRKKNKEKIAEYMRKYRLKQSLIWET